MGALRDLQALHDRTARPPAALVVESHRRDDASIPSAIHMPGSLVPRKNTEDTDTDETRAETAEIAEAAGTASARRPPAGLQETRERQKQTAGNMRCLFLSLSGLLAAKRGGGTLWQPLAAARGTLHSVEWRSSRVLCVLCENPRS